MAHAVVAERNQATVVELQRVIVLAGDLQHAGARIAIGLDHRLGEGRARCLEVRHADVAQLIDDDLLGLGDQPVLELEPEADLHRSAVRLHHGHVADLLGRYVRHMNLERRRPGAGGLPQPLGRLDAGEVLDDHGVRRERRGLGVVRDHRGHIAVGDGVETVAGQAARHHASPVWRVLNDPVFGLSYRIGEGPRVPDLRRFAVRQNAVKTTVP